MSTALEQYKQDLLAINRSTHMLINETEAYFEKIRNTKINEQLANTLLSIDNYILAFLRNVLDDKFDIINKKLDYQNELENNKFNLSEVTKKIINKNNIKIIAYSKINDNFVNLTNSIYENNTLKLRKEDILELGNDIIIIISNSNILKKDVNATLLNYPSDSYSVLETPFLDENYSKNKLFIKDQNNYIYESIIYNQGDNNGSTYLFIDKIKNNLNNFIFDIVEYEINDIILDIKINNYDENDISAMLVNKIVLDNNTSEYKIYDEDNREQIIKVLKTYQDNYLATTVRIPV